MIRLTGELRRPILDVQNDRIHSIAVLTGERVITTLRNAQFRREWEDLYDGTPWAWAGECPGFLIPWYELYSEHLAILVIARDPLGKLTGMLPLCIPAGDRTVLCGGTGDAEYVSWLCHAEDSPAFLPLAIAAVRREVGPYPITLGYLNPETPIEWATNRSDPISTLCSLEAHESFMIPTVAKESVEQFIRGKRRLKTKLNSLKKRGTVRYVEYDTPSIDGALDDFFPMFLARRNLRGVSLPPSELDRKRALAHRLKETDGLFHAAGLELDGQPVAMHMGVAARGVLCVAGLAHSPFFNDLSVGQLLILALVEALHNEGFRYFDLSPGTEEYKSRLGVEAKSVHRVHVAPSFRRRLPEIIRRELKNRIPASVLNHLKKALVPHPEPLPRSALPTIYELANPHKGDAGGGLEENCLPHLLKYAPSRSGDRAAFLNEMNELLHAGGFSLSRLSGDALDLAWFLVPARRSRFGPEDSLPRDGWILRAARNGPVPSNIRQAIEAALGSLPKHIDGPLFAAADLPGMAKPLEELGFRKKL